MTDIAPSQLAELVAHAPFGAVLNMPTGAGKTWIACEAIQRVIRNGHRAIFITPLRALAEELTANFRQLIGEDVPVGIFTGDYGNRKKYPVPFSEARLLVMTPERLDACTRAWRTHWRWIPEVDLVVVDEVHLLADPGRGPRLEGAISRFRRLNPFARFAGLSATIGNPQELADWLDGGAFKTNERPVPLEWKIVRYKKAVDKPDLMAQEVHRAVAAGGSSLVFVQSRRRAEQLAKHLAESGIEAAHHHAGLNHQARQSVEESFRRRETKALVATSTLEMGLNLPVRQVVLYDLQAFDGSEFTALSTNSVWQRVGRAGRRGLDERGEAVLLAANWDRKASDYPKGRFERIESAMGRSSALTEQIVVEVASGLARSRTQVDHALGNSLASHQQQKLKLDETIDQMIKARMLSESVDEDDANCRMKLRATRLGRIAVRHMVSPATVLKIDKAYRTSEDLTIFDTLILLTSAAECEPVLAVDFEELESLSAEINTHPSNLLRETTTKELCERTQVDSRRLLAALKMACVLRRWTRCGNVAETAEELDCYPFEAARLAESSARLSLALHEIAKCQREIVEDEIEEPPSEETQLDEKLYALEKMLSHGIDEQVTTLTFVPGLGGVMAKRLHEHGICDIEDLALTEADDLLAIHGISNKRAQGWIESAESLVKERHAFSLAESQTSEDLARVRNTEFQCDPYRLRRAMELRIEGRVGDAFRVVGGLEPHRVLQRGSRWSCDCMDHKKGNLCKHILAVRLMRKDPELIHIVRSLEESDCETSIDLFDLWFVSDRKLAKRRNA